MSPTSVTTTFWYKVAPLKNGNTYAIDRAVRSTGLCTDRQVECRRMWNCSYNHQNHTSLLTYCHIVCSRRRSVHSQHTPSVNMITSSSVSHKRTFVMRLRKLLCFSQIAARVQHNRLGLLQLNCREGGSQDPNRICGSQDEC